MKVAAKKGGVMISLHLATVAHGVTYLCCRYLIACLSAGVATEKIRSPFLY